MTFASEEKWRPFNCFFQSDRAKDLSAPLYLFLCVFLLKLMPDTYPGVKTAEACP